ncbi:MAG: cysteine--tRNA ligase [Elusimicrobia bacterium RIFOXYA2_FULL_53_38]|nr:MAG: cysteine--tRNA ligase [Elusimicrobia bacterium RIFOXYA2_FULL_53_38]
MKIYNSLTRGKEDFKQITPGEVKMYACGITVYDECHIGHAMQAIFFDVIRRYLEYLGNKVTYVRNYTDVDDKIIAKGIELGLDPLDVSSKYITEAEKDMRALKVRPATYQPKVSDNIPEIQDFIIGLLDKGAAYVSNGEVFFDVPKFKDYGRLSGRKTEELLSEDGPTTNKRSPFDFSLWKPAKPGEPVWDSPWGQGRPGWHIECSALANKFLGKTLDIHGGGLDIIFPHHENEIAQSEALNSCKFANYWIHNGLVMVDNRKMSKSLKNFYTIKDALAKYQADVIRYMILSFSVSSNVNFSEDNLSAANKRVYLYYQILQQIDEFLAKYPAETTGKPTGVQAVDSLKNDFTASMDDFFNSAKVLSTLPAVFKAIQEVLLAKTTPSGEKAGILREFRHNLGDITGVLGILDETPADYTIEFKNRYIRNNEIDISFIASKIKERATARGAGDYIKADAIREELFRLNILIQDKPNGTDWTVAS